jgi:SAM-dependent methyltransferase
VSFADHFSRQAGAYAAFRPTYPEELIRHLVSFAPARDLAWDCATGNGQAARLLAVHFRMVLATDASAEQIAAAPADPRISYRVAREDGSGAPDGAVDLVCVAQALHWLDLPRLYREVDRVLKPDGVIAVWSYGRLTTDPRIAPVIDRFYDQRVGRYWPAGREHVEAGYRDLPFPFDEIPPGEWRMTARLSLRNLLGYVGTWSAVARARETEGRDPLAELEAALAPTWPDPDEEREVAWPLAVRIGRRRATPR